MTSALLRLPALLHTTPHSFQKHIQSHTTSNVINGTGLPGSQNTFHPSETLSLTPLAPGCYFVSLLPFLCGNNLHRCVANRILVISTLVCTAAALTEYIHLHVVCIQLDKGCFSNNILFDNKGEIHTPTGNTFLQAGTASPFSAPSATFSSYSRW